MVKTEIKKNKNKILIKTMAVDQNCQDSHQKKRSNIKACEVSRKKYSRNYTLNLWLRAGGGGFKSRPCLLTLNSAASFIPLCFKLPAFNMGETLQSFFFFAGKAR